MVSLIIIEIASIEHLNELYEIEKKCFKNEAFSKEHLYNLLIHPNSINLIARSGKTIVGFIIGITYYEDSLLIGHILTIDVLPEYRRRGIGAKLLSEIEKIFIERGVLKCRLEVREDNTAAIALYKKFGYLKVRKLHRYYGGVDGVLFEKFIGERSQKF